jgi:hypothetical protein
MSFVLFDTQRRVFSRRQRRAGQDGYKIASILGAEGGSAATHRSAADVVRLR